jgi:alkanesulfonate monooxygenase SsuD/methylene tetrahydromethanopterin reductase-like flavin-dependent oxidoreductase (luciferase family)
MSRSVDFPAIGVGTPLGFGIAAPALVAYARAADEAGLADISVGELRSTEVFALASAMIAATEHAFIETSIVAAVTRAPTLLAMGAATLAQLSNGRFRLGIGAGSPIVAAWHGAQFDAPLRKVEHTVDLVRASLAGERVDELGSFRLSGEMVGDVPVILSALNNGMLRLAGRKANGVVVQFCDPAQAGRMGAVARAARQDVGVEMPFELIVNVWAFAGDDREQAEAAFRREVAPYLAVPTYRAAAAALSSPAEVETAAARWRTGGREAAAEAVPRSLTDALLVVLGRDDVEGRLAAYRRAGCDRIRFVPLTPVPGDDTHARAVVEALGEVCRRMQGGRAFSSGQRP